MKKLFALGCCLLPLASVRAGTTELTIVVDMTPAGRKLVHPTPEHPAYYLPLMGGFKLPLAKVAFGEKPPPDAHVAKEVSEALAHQGYVLARPGLVFNDRHEATYADGAVITVPRDPLPSGPAISLNERDGEPLTEDMLGSRDGPYAIRVAAAHGRDWMRLPVIRVMRAAHPVHGPVMQRMPSFVMVIRWGDAISNQQGTRPSVLVDDSGGIISLIAGDSFRDLSMFDQDAMVLRMNLDRFYVTVSAYDFRAMLLHNKPVLLWSAKMTVPSNGGAEFDPLLPVLVRAGESHFGRESARPELRTVKFSDGKVIIGKPRVVGDDSADNWSELKPLETN